ncbi:hypothetical protein [Anabaena azotica]|uniref:hypothetical protein n=1 Tax=Anabaena azotica TaxID=197653 RepID=UPI0039A74A73
MSQPPDKFDPQQPDANQQQQADSYINDNAIQGNENSAVQGNDNQSVLGENNIVNQGNNNTQNINIYWSAPSTQQQFKQEIPHTQQQPEREIPSLLPYLANRSEQEYELDKAIKKLIEKNLPYPLICIIHGDEYQSHDKFLERLHKVSLPKFLGLDSNQDLIKKYHLPCSAQLNTHEFPDYLRKNLSDSVRGDSLASLEEINDFFYKCSIPVLIHTHLFTEQWTKQRFEILHKLLDFWQQWPDLRNNQKIIFCIFIKYKIRRKKSTNDSQKKSVFGFIINFIKQYRYQRLNQKICHYLETLSLSKFENFNRLSGVVLPKLIGVKREDVENWVRMEYTQNVIGEAMADKLIREIRDLFEKWEEQNSSNIIPMDDLAEDLIKLMKSNLSGKGAIT